MEEKAQRVVVIQAASREICSSAVKWALEGLSLKPDDKLTLVSVIHQVYTHCKSPNAGSKKLLGYKSRVESHSMFDANEKIVEKEVAKKTEEYAKNPQLQQISQLYEKQKVQFSIEVVTGPVPRKVALNAAMKLKATWVILDRQMKKDRKYLLEELECGISRMKRNNRIELLRGPKATKTNAKKPVTYDDMVPGLPDDLFSIEIPPREGVTEADQKCLQAHEMTEECTKTEVAKKEWEAEDIFQRSTCSLCKNTRPNISFQRNFSYKLLHDATDSFSQQNSLSEGGKGYAFRGQLKSTNNLKIMVKQQPNISPEGEMDFETKVNVLMKARHKNVLMLLGFCTEESLKLLVYEYACNGSLSRHLSKHCPLPLTWTERMKVALGTAKGLKYLHENGILHNNLRTSNIVLTHDFEALLGDFGFSSELQVLETLEYLAPEYLGNRELSTATDIYAFGVVLLEMITGRTVTHKVLIGGRGLVEWARPFVKARKLLPILDRRVGNSYDAVQLYWMGRVIQNCLNKNPEKRFPMDKVVCALECIADRRAQDLMQDVCAVRSYLNQKDRKGFEHQSLVSSGSSSSLSSSFPLRTSASFSRSSTSSAKSVKLQRGKAGTTRLCYSEMLS